MLRTSGREGGNGRNRTAERGAKDGEVAATTAATDEAEEEIGGMWTRSGVADAVQKRYYRR